MMLVQISVAMADAAMMILNFRAHSSGFMFRFQCSFIDVDSLKGFFLGASHDTRATNSGVGLVSCIS